MDTQILGWADLGIDIVEVAVIVAVLLVLLRLHRDINALLRVIRRMDRNTTSLTTSAHWRRAQLNEAPLTLRTHRKPGWAVQLAIDPCKTIPLTNAGSRLRTSSLCSPALTRGSGASSRIWNTPPAVSALPPTRHRTTKALCRWARSSSRRPSSGPVPHGPRPRRRSDCGKPAPHRK
jgi:hypothetical protein